MLNRNFHPFPVLNTERLTLRQLQPSDEEQIFLLRSDPEINRYLERTPAKTIDDARQFISKVNEQIQRNDSLYWAITFHGYDSLLGTVCLFSFSAENKTCETGYELLARFQGKGIMKEALDKVISHAFDVIGIRQIEAVTHKDNRDSIQLLNRCLFRLSEKPSNEGPDLRSYYLAKI